jgi:YHS domain-containing protein
VKAFTNHGARVLGAIAIVMMAAIYLGCGSKEKAESPAEKTEKAATTTESSQPQATSETQTAPDTEDWAAAYDNPKKGIDPVCGMTLEREYVEVATIGDKKYALCSVGCAEMLKADPDKYLKADASTESQQ